MTSQPRSGRGAAPADHGDRRVGDLPAAESPGAAGRRIPVGLSTSSVFPEGTERAFALAAELGYDGIELMVTADRHTQDPAWISELAERHGLPVLSVHAPCLAISARVWGTDPVGKLERSVALAADLGAQTVVTHPPFLWQRSSEPFVDAASRLAAEHAGSVRIAVENMYPVRVLGVPMTVYKPDWNVALADYPGYTLDISHTAIARMDAVELAAAMGDRLAHVHLGDGSGLARDEHLVPGRGTARCADVLRGLANGGFSGGDTAPAGAAVSGGAAASSGAAAGAGPARFDGSVILEVSTRTLDAADRERDLAEALAFAREHLGQR